MQERYYRPSGGFSPVFFAYLLACGLLVVPVCYAYAHLVYYMPYIYLNILATVGCGFVMGLLVSGAMHLGKVRNSAIAVIAAVVFTAFAKYVQWVFYIPIAYLEFDFLYNLSVSLDLFFFPPDVIAFIKEINLYGVWSIGESDTNVTGIFLYVIWACEFIIMLVVSVIMARNKSRNPFCDEEGRWFKFNKKSDERLLDVPEDLAAFKDALESGQTEALTGLLGVPLADANRYLRLSLYHLDGVDYGYIKVESVTVTADKRKRTTTKSEKLLEYLTVGKETLSALRVE
ncbi:MAG: hypothetical protein LBR83_07500 [Clostridiales bacterium]|jgi:hypothetical protein|nr:hypothetical protein [Clostridiales bacterium]